MVRQCLCADPARLPHLQSKQVGQGADRHLPLALRDAGRSSRPPFRRFSQHLRDHRMNRGRRLQAFPGGIVQSLSIDMNAEGMINQRVQQYLAQGSFGIIHDQYQTP